MDAIRQKLSRKLSHKDQNPDFDGDDDFDDETAGNLHRDIEAAEGDEKNPQGRPGSFLNRLISHGNKKTQDDILRESQDTREGQRQ